MSPRGLYIFTTSTPRVKNALRAFLHVTKRSHRTCISVLACSKCCQHSCNEGKCFVNIINDCLGQVIHQKCAKNATIRVVYRTIKISVEQHQALLDLDACNVFQGFVLDFECSILLLNPKLVIIRKGNSDTCADEEASTIQKLQDYLVSYPELVLLDVNGDFKMGKFCA